MIIATLFTIGGVYLACGILFALPFVVLGVRQIDPQARHGSWGFRLLIIPGTVALWPLLFHRWWVGTSEPPNENTAHRRGPVSATTKS